MKWSEGEIMAEFKEFKPNARYWSTGIGGYFASVLFDNESTDKDRPYVGKIESPHATGPVPFIMRRRFSCFERAEAWAIDTAKDLSNGASLPE